MTAYKRLITQVYDIDAENPQQADEIARIRATAVNTALRPLGMSSAWGVSVADGVSGTDELMDILTDCYLLDEIDDNPERNPHAGYIPAQDTMVPDLLMAWRDAAVKAALDQAAAGQDGQS